MPLSPDPQFSSTDLPNQILAPALTAGGLFSSVELERKVVADVKIRRGMHTKFLKLALELKAARPASKRRKGLK
ncbi:hypothetical protein BaRGS_00033284 [Batillaria attramentaria]|uniref:Uncharacterized protein n=1 Tax=Batillaria attramentaria TaxID=370345 RepID=A0ABD0JLB0_9CAEN